MEADEDREAPAGPALSGNRWPLKMGTWTRRPTR